MSDEMIQRVARALCALDCKAASGILGSEDLCIFGECSRWGDNTGHARAAIEAMREPTEYMLSHALGDGAWCTANSWRAMIDAALGGTRWMAFGWLRLARWVVSAVRRIFGARTR